MPPPARWPTCSRSTRLPITLWAWRQRRGATPWGRSGPTARRCSCYPLWVSVAAQCGISVGQPYEEAVAVAPGRLGAGSAACSSPRKSRPDISAATVPSPPACVSSLPLLASLLMLDAPLTLHTCSSTHSQAPTPGPRCDTSLWRTPAPAPACRWPLRCASTCRARCARRGGTRRRWSCMGRWNSCQVWKDGNVVRLGHGDFVG